MRSSLLLLLLFVPSLPLSTCLECTQYYPVFMIVSICLSLLFSSLFFLLIFASVTSVMCGKSGKIERQISMHTECMVIHAYMYTHTLMHMHIRIRIQKQIDTYSHFNEAPASTRIKKLAKIHNKERARQRQCNMQKNEGETERRTAHMHAQHGCAEYVPPLLYLSTAF
mmetsp:Transcript_29258/g.75357  ORF Transcript_29258/g.75357 Transcript_29258/m.75357 type:complete len:168 (-) Transcript_29258:239-742(-)